MFTKWKSSILPQLLTSLLLLFGFTLLVVYFKTLLLTYRLFLNPAIFTLFGIALAIFLGFRNSVNYDRFWKARKLWGALLNITRSLARQSYNLVNGKEYTQERKAFMNLLITFVYSLKHQLRFTDSEKDMEGLLTKELVEQLNQAHFKPVIILKELGTWVQEAKGQGKLDSFAQLVFEENLNKFSDVVGGCERIANTPIPYTYNVPFIFTVLCCLLGLWKALDRLCLL